MFYLSVLCLGLFFIQSVFFIFLNLHLILSLLYLVLFFIFLTITLVYWSFEFMGFFIILIYIGAISMLFLFILLLFKLIIAQITNNNLFYQLFFYIVLSSFCYRFWFLNYIYKLDLYQNLTIFSLNDLGESLFSINYSIILIFFCLGLFSTVLSLILITFQKIKQLIL